MKKKKAYCCVECGCILRGECAESRLARAETVLQQIADMDIGRNVTDAQDLIEEVLGIESQEESA